MFFSLHSQCHSGTEQKIRDGRVNYDSILVRNEFPSSPRLGPFPRHRHNPIPLIPSRDYGPTLIAEINNARVSVSAYLYLFALYPTAPSPDHAHSHSACYGEEPRVRVVEQFTGLERKYGRDKIEKAAAIISKKAVDNPHRSVGYFVGTVMSLP